MLERGDRVKRKDGKSFDGENMVAIVDCDEPHDTRKGPEVFVCLREARWNTTTNVLVDEIEKIEDYKLTMDEFFVELQSWLCYKNYESTDCEYKVVYSAVIEKLQELKSHIGY